MSLKGLYWGRYYFEKSTLRYYQYTKHDDADDNTIESKNGDTGYL